MLTVLALIFLAHECPAAVVRAPGLEMRPIHAIPSSLSMPSNHTIKDALNDKFVAESMLPGHPYLNDVLFIETLLGDARREILRKRTENPLASGGLALVYSPRMEDRKSVV